MSFSPADKHPIKKARPPINALKGDENILLVDDEEMILEVSGQMLDKLGYTVLAARSGKEAVQVFKEKMDKIDLVILDLIMPGMDGRETYRLLKDTKPEVKVLLSSGYSIEGKAVEILDWSCDGFIQKPFDLVKLYLKIREILDRKPNRNERVLAD